MKVLLNEKIKLIILKLKVYLSENNRVIDF